MASLLQSAIDAVLCKFEKTIEQWKTPSNDSSQSRLTECFVLELQLLCQGEHEARSKAYAQVLDSLGLD